MRGIDLDKKEPPTTTFGSQSSVMKQIKLKLKVPFNATVKAAEESGHPDLKKSATKMKSIKLPSGLAKAIEDKLESEQRAQQMEFELLRERSEAQRRVIEAEGIRDAQLVLTEGLNENIIRYQSIEAFKSLASSPNAKVIITDGKTPFLIQGEVPKGE